MTLLLRRLAELPVTVTLTVLLAVTALDRAVLPARTQERLVEWASTDVHRLVTQPFGPLLVSPFVNPDRPVLWIALALVGLAAAESRLGWGRVLAIALGGHVVATLASQGVVAWRQAHGALPETALHQVDVGASYVAVAALAAGAVVVRPWWLVPVPVAALALAAPQLTAGLDSLDVRAVGHVTAFLFGGIIGWVSVVGHHDRLRIRGPRPIRRTPARASARTRARHQY